MSYMTTMVQETLQKEDPLRVTKGRYFGSNLPRNGNSSKLLSRVGRGITNDNL